MEIQELKTIINDMAVQHSYPGFDMRSLKLGLPEAITRSPARLFKDALQDNDVLVRLAALRWFQERPGDAKKNLDVLVKTLDDQDEWVRLEGIATIAQIANTKENTNAKEAIVEAVARLLTDESLQVQKAAANACGKFQLKTQTVIEQLKQAAQSNDVEVRWKSQKALRKLGMYSQPN